MIKKRKRICIFLFSLLIALKIIPIQSDTHASTTVSTVTIPTIKNEHVYVYKSVHQGDIISLPHTVNKTDENGKTISVNISWDKYYSNTPEIDNTSNQIDTKKTIQCWYRGSLAIENAPKVNVIISILPISPSKITQYGDWIYYIKDLNCNFKLNTTGN